jgi:hypothetical protein
MTSMRQPSLVCAAMVAAGWLVGCSRLFDSDRTQCSSAADCAALGGDTLVCVEGLCALDSDSNAQTADDGGPASESPDGVDGSMSDGKPSDAAEPEDDSERDAGRDSGASLPGDAGPDPMVSADCPADNPAVLFCDGFESDFVAWQREPDDQTRLSIVSDDVACGARALEAETLTRGKRWAEVRATFAEIEREPLWVRASLWAHGDLDYDVITVLRLESSATSEGIDLSLEGGAPRALLFADLAETERERADDQPFPVDRYTCVELAFTPSLLTGSASLYVDGRLAATQETPLPSAPLDTVRTGIFFTSDNHPPVALRVDAVAVSTERLGCP